MSRLYATLMAERSHDSEKANSKRAIRLLVVDERLRGRL